MARIVSWLWMGLLLAGAAMTAVLAVKAWQRRRVPGGAYFALMMAGVAIWSALYALEATLPGVQAKLDVAKAEYLGIASVPVFWALFSLAYTGYDTLARRIRGPLLVLPAVTLLLALTSGFHHLLWSGFSLGTSGSWTPLTMEHGPWFWIHVLYSYALLLAGTVLLVGSARRYPKRYQLQALLILAAAVLPWVGNAAYLFRLLPDRNLDPTPFAFAVSGCILGWALLRFRLLERPLGLRPAARRAIMETMQGALLVLDADDEVVDVNPTAAAVLSGSREDLLGKSLETVLDGLRKPSGAAAAKVSPGDLQLLGEEGERTYELVRSPFGQPGAEGQGSLLLLRDVTEKRQGELAIRKSEARYRNLFEHANDLIFTLDRAGHFKTVNPALAKVTGYSREELLRKSAPDLADGLSLESLDESPFLGTEFGMRELELRNKDGVKVAVEVSLRALHEHGELVGYAGIGRDITASRMWEEALADQARRDNTTGLSNWSFLSQRITEVLSAAEASDLYALYLLDLDKFGEVDESFGHGIGDLALQELATRLTASFRSTDLIARLGGDRFVVFLAVASPRQAREYGARILGLLAPGFELDEETLALSGSLGIALAPLHGLEPERLLLWASRAMRLAKQAGGGKCVLHQPRRSHGGRTTPLAQGELGAAFAREEFSLYFQPQVDLRSQETVAFEALLRWHHPERGLLLPNDFLPALELGGYTRTLSAWVLRSGLKQLEEWKATGLDTRVAVNLSARELEDPELLGMIDETLRGYSVAPHCLTVELTEGSLMRDRARGLVSLETIRSLGLRVAVDDFGAGHATLDYLRALPLDELKIDISYVRKMTLEKKDASIVQAIIRLAHELDLTVVAEGVESQATAKLLLAYGCDLGQGYYFGRPMTAAAATSRLRRDGEPGPAAGGARPQLHVVAPTTAAASKIDRRSSTQPRPAKQAQDNTRG